MIFDPLPALPNNEVLLLKHLIVALGSSGPPPVFVGPLDNFTTDLAVAQSVEERLLSSYPETSPLIRVRRSSDNTELNIGSTSSGALDTVALLAFAGAGSAFVVTLYDQSGHGKHATQSTAVNQPRIVNAGVLDTAGMVFSGNQYLDIAAAPFTDYATATSVQVLVTHNWTGGTSGVLFDFNASTDIVGLLPEAGGILWAAPYPTATLQYVPSSIFNVERKYSWERDAFDIRFRINGTVDNSGVGASGNITGNSIFRLGNGISLTGRFIVGTIKNFCVWKTAAPADCAARSAAL